MDRKQELLLTMCGYQTYYAYELVYRGMRAPHVEKVCKIPKSKAQRIWHEVHNVASPSGRMPESTGTTIKTVRDVAHASLWLAHYIAARGGLKAVRHSYTAESLIQSYDAYMASLSQFPDDDICSKQGISIDQMYIIARDLRSRQGAEIRTCSTCGVYRIYSIYWTQTHMLGCPFCQMLSRRRGPAGVREWVDQPSVRSH